MSRAPGLRKSHLEPLGWLSVDLSFKSMNLNQPYYFVNTQISWTEFLICSEAHQEDLKQKKERKKNSKEKKFKFWRHCPEGTVLPEASSPPLSLTAGDREA